MQALFAALWQKKAIAGLIPAGYSLFVNERPVSGRSQLLLS
jgi:hypothetical protein